MGFVWSLNNIMILVASLSLQRDAKHEACSHARMLAWKHLQALVALVGTGIRERATERRMGRVKVSLHSSYYFLNSLTNAAIRLVKNDRLQKTSAMVHFTIQDGVCRLCSRSVPQAFGKF